MVTTRALAVAVLVFAAAAGCGSDDDAVGEAPIEIVTVPLGDETDGQPSSDGADQDGSADPDQPVSDGDGAGGTGDDGAAGDQEAAEGGADDAATGPGDDVVAPAADAEGTATLVSDDTVMSTLPPGATGIAATADLTIDRVYTTTSYGDEIEAAAGEKLLVVEYQLLGRGRGNFHLDVFRLSIDGAPYSPVDSGGGPLVKAGRVVNSEIAFAVPADATSFTLEGGVPLDAREGRTTVFAIDLGPATTPDPQPAIGNDEVEALTATVEPPTEGPLTMIGGAFDRTGRVSIEGASLATTAGDTRAFPTTMFVRVDYLVVPDARENFSTNSLRLEADGEWFSPIDDDLIPADAGENIRGTVVFEVPRSATELILEAGAPPAWGEGEQTRFTITIR